MSPRDLRDEILFWFVMIGGFGTMITAAILLGMSVAR